MPALDLYERTKSQVEKTVVEIVNLVGIIATPLAEAVSQNLRLRSALEEIAKDDGTPAATIANRALKGD